MKSQLNNEKGATLVFVLVIFIFISIIALGVISVATNESLQAIQKNKKIQAEYLSLSGIQIMTEYIENYYDDFLVKYENYDSNFPVVFDSTDLGEDGKVTVEILQDDDTEQLKIVSTGEYKDVIYKKKRNITLTKMPVSNDLPESFYVGTDNNDDVNYEPVVVPNPDDIHDDISLNSGSTMDLELTNEILRIDDITLKPNSELTIKADTNEKATRTIIVGSITAGNNSTIKIPPNLTLYMYITGNSDFKLSPEYNVIDGEEPTNTGSLFLLVEKDIKVTILINPGEIVAFYVYAYGPEAYFDFKNHSDVVGFIVGKDEEPDLFGQATGTYLEPTPELKEFFMQNMYDEYERFIPQDYVK